MWIKKFYPVHDNMFVDSSVCVMIYVGRLECASKQVCPVDRSCTISLCVLCGQNNGDRPKREKRRRDTFWRFCLKMPSIFSSLVPAFCIYTYLLDSHWWWWTKEPAAPLFFLEARTFFFFALPLSFYEAIYERKTKIGRLKGAFQTVYRYFVHI